MKNFEIKSIKDFKEFEKYLEEKRVELLRNNGLLKPYVISVQDWQEFKTQQQNKAFHKMLNLYYISGCHSQDVKSLDDLKAYYKHKIGLIDYYLFYNGKKIKRVDSKKDIPSYIKRNACRIILKSWSQATKEQAIEAIELLKTDMINSQVLSSKYGKEFENLLNNLELK